MVCVCVCMCALCPLALNSDLSIVFGADYYMMSSATLPLFRWAAVTTASSLLSLLPFQLLLLYYYCCFILTSSADRFRASAVGLPRYIEANQNLTYIVMREPHRCWVALYTYTLYPQFTHRLSPPPPISLSLCSPFSLSLSRAVTLTLIRNATQATGIYICMNKIRALNLLPAQICGDGIYMAKNEKERMCVCVHVCTVYNFGCKSE